MPKTPQTFCIVRHSQERTDCKACGNQLYVDVLETGYLFCPHCGTEWKHRLSETRPDGLPRWAADYGFDLAGYHRYIDQVGSMQQRRAARQYQRWQAEIRAYMPNHDRAGTTARANKYEFVIGHGGNYESVRAMVQERLEGATSTARRHPGAIVELEFYNQENPQRVLKFMRGPIFQQTPTPSRSAITESLLTPIRFTTS